MNAYAYEEKLQICGGFIRSTYVDLRTTYVDREIPLREAAYFLARLPLFPLLNKKNRCDG